jgi:hypothetical protein
MRHISTPLATLLVVGLLVVLPVCANEGGDGGEYGRTLQ